jgi:hypothetical protein
VAAIELANSVSNFFLDQAGRFIFSPDCYFLSECIFLVSPVFGQKPVLAFYIVQYCFRADIGYNYGTGQNLYQT